MITLRRAFLLFVAPLFLLLAGVNGALLYVWERSEAERQLDNQALAAAVTVAAFAAGADDLAATLRDPLRDRSFREAAARVEGLDGLYIVAADGAVTQIAGRPRPQGPGRFAAPAKAVALPVADMGGRRLATALAPMPGGRFVVAQIDAQGLDAEVATLRAIVVALLAAAGVLGVGLAWYVGSRIARELAANRVAIEAIRAGEPAPSSERLRIRETRDLANAVRLMQTSVAGRMARSGRELALRDRRRDVASAATAYRESAFPPLSTTSGGAALAVRILGAAPAGSFYALCEADGRTALVLGEADATDPAEALSQALAARTFLERRALDGDVGVRVSQAKAAFGLNRVAWAAWTADAPPPQAVTLLPPDAAARAEAYARTAAGVSPPDAVADLAVLLDAAGVVAVIRGG